MNIHKIHSIYWADADKTVVALVADTEEGTLQQITTPYSKESIIWDAISTILPDKITSNMPEATEQLVASVRYTRNRLLYESDWTQVLDAPVDRQAWAAYRQSLRDITLQSGFPFDVTWPTPPTV